MKNLMIVNGTNFAPEIAKKMLADGDIDLCFNAFSNENKIFENKKEIRISVNMCVKANYEEICDWNNIPVVSKELMVEMTKFESMALKLGMRTTEYPIADYEQEKMSYSKHLRFWSYIIKKYNINRIYFDEVPHFQYTYVIYGLAQVYNIKCLVCMCSAISGVNVYGDSIQNLGKEIGEFYEQIKEIDSEYIQLEGNVKQYYDKYSNIEKVIQERISTNFISNERERNRKDCKNYASYYNEFKIFKDRYRILMASLVKRKSLNWYYENKPELDRRILLGKRIKLFKKYSMVSCEEYDKLAENPDLTCKYIYFALQLTPECTTMPMAGVFADQYTSIVLLAKIAEAYNITVYVKDHFVQLYRDKRVYELLQSIPNVKLIKSSFSSMKLIEKSIAVSTQTGSCILEAAMMEKPSLCFGDGYLWKGLPTVFEITSEEQGKNILETIIMGRVDYDKEKIKKYFYAIQNKSIYGHSNYGNFFGEDTSKEFKSSVNQKVQLIKEKLL